jgi:hypothetical protein
VCTLDRRILTEMHEQKEITHKLARSYQPARRQHSAGSLQLQFISHQLR